jgi:hypothetical protein
MLSLMSGSLQNVEFGPQPAAESRETTPQGRRRQAELCRCIGIAPAFVDAQTVNLSIDLVEPTDRFGHQFLEVENLSDSVWTGPDVGKFVSRFKPDTSPGGAS